MSNVENRNDQLVTSVLTDKFKWWKSSIDNVRGLRGSEFDTYYFFSPIKYYGFEKNISVHSGTSKSGVIYHVVEVTSKLL